MLANSYTPASKMHRFAGPGAVCPGIRVRGGKGHVSSGAGTAGHPARAHRGRGPRPDLAVTGNGFRMVTVDLDVLARARPAPASPAQPGPAPDSSAKCSSAARGNCCTRHLS